MRLPLFLIGLLLCGQVAAQNAVYIDKGACTGEGCRYGEKWTAFQSVTLLEQPDKAAKPVATIPAGASVQTVTGEVYTVPSRFVVRRSHGEFVPGDDVLLYTYLGEGRFRLRHNGVLKDVDLNFSPQGGSGGSRCEKNEARCWGTLENELKFEWWVKVRAEGGIEGWVRGSMGFATPETH